MRKKLDRLIKKEGEQLEHTEDLTDQSEQPTALEMESLKGGEKRNQRSAEDLEQQAAQMGPDAAAAAGALSGAGQSMGGAGSSLAKQELAGAATQQKIAMKELERAREELKQLEQRLREEIESLARRRVTEHLAKMLTMQRKVRKTTEKLKPRVATKQRQAVQAARQLALVEDRIVTLASQSIELVETTQFSMALPVALRDVEHRMIAVSDSLRSGRANDSVITREKQIEEDLQALLDAMKDTISPGNNAGGKCKGCDGNRNNLLAEIKMLRWMQNSVHRDTKNVDEMYRNSELTGKLLRRRTETLARKQDAIRGVADQLHHLTCPDCLMGIE